MRDSFNGHVPEGEYHAIDSPEQAAAVKHSKRIAEELVIEHPEIADLYRQGLSYSEIAAQIIPNVMAEYPNIAPKAVGYAVRSINNPEEQKVLTSAHRQATLETTIGDRMSRENRKVWKRAQKKRTEEYGAPTNELIRGRGQTPWDEAQKMMLTQLLADAQYKKENGTPDYASIAHQLNTRLHNGKPVRTSKSLGNYVRDLKRKSKKKNK